MYLRSMLAVVCAMLYQKMKLCAAEVTDCVVLWFFICAHYIACHMFCVTSDGPLMKSDLELCQPAVTWQLCFLSD